MKGSVSRRVWRHESDESCGAAALATSGVIEVVEAGDMSRAGVACMLRLAEESDASVSSGSHPIVTVLCLC